MGAVVRLRCLPAALAALILALAFAGGADGGVAGGGDAVQSTTDTVVGSADCAPVYYDNGVHIDWACLPSVLECPPACP